MPRFFFDIDDGASRVVDEVGLLLPGPQAALQQAMLALPDMMREAMHGGLWRECSVRIRDEIGDTICTAVLSLAVQWSDAGCNATLPVAGPSQVGGDLLAV